MLLKKLFRYAICLVVSMVLLFFILPLTGIVQAKFLPPPYVYSRADGKTSGQITSTYTKLSGDPWRIGEHNYFWDYTFYAKQLPPGATKPVLVAINGEVRVNEASYPKKVQGDTVLVLYDKTYPWVNGLYDPNIGVGCGEGSNILSGWLIWVGVAFVVAFILLAILNHFLPKEDF